MKRYRGYRLEYRPAGAAPPMNLKWVVRDPATGRPIHRAPTEAAARAWIDAQVTS